ncbi:MAG TPA: polysaccharide deacetylase family protein [Thermoanaerobaculia bacterium]|jgi:peptidoglycan/xylan/chitin deacetylase (PgdA/CDA1 family)
MRAILMYHSIDTSGSTVSCHPEAFDRHVRWLSSGRVEVTSIEGLFALPPSIDAVAITFDDGFVNFRDFAAPRLLANGLTSTVFVVAEHAGQTNAWDRREPDIPQQPLLDWSALALLREQGVMLGSHSRTHPNLATLSRARIEEEVCGSVEIIERETGARPETFAYPYGRVNAQAAAVVERVFRHACTTEFRLLDAGARLARLPRLDAFYFQEPGLLESWGTPRFETFITRRHRQRRL